jgi:hypothetical protein
MKAKYQARRVSRNLAHALRKSGTTDRGVLLDTCNGFIVIEPCNSPLGDGAVLTHQDAIMEIQPAWCQERKSKVERAHHLLGLEAVGAL